jgi:hypothetical protein
MRGREFLDAMLRGELPLPPIFPPRGLGVWCRDQRAESMTTTLRPGTSKFTPVARLERRDVMPLHTDLPKPCEYGVGLEFRAVVADDHLTCGCR